MDRPTTLANRSPSGVKVRYIGASDRQVRWGGNDDPRPLLTEGCVYELDFTIEHTWHTKYALRGVTGLFNSVSFEVV